MAYVILLCISRHALITLVNVKERLYVDIFVGFLFKNISFKSFQLLCTATFWVKEGNAGDFPLQLFCFICSMKERKNAFSNENEVIIVSWFFLRIITMKGNYDFIWCIIKLMDLKIKWCLLPYPLPERWFRKIAEWYSEVFNINDS